MSKVLSEESGYSYWEFERIIAWSFNRLKGKLYNIIEASVESEKQQKALKDLIRGFANEEYRRCINETRPVGTVLKLINKEDMLPESAEPLENKNGIFG